MDLQCSAGALREVIRRLERKLGVLDEVQSSCCGVTFAQCHALVEIGRAQRLSLNDLANMIGLDKSTMSRTVNNLVNGGMAVRENDPMDRRYLTIRLTDLGLAAYQEIENGMDAYFSRIFHSIPCEKREQVIESLEILLRALGHEGCCKEC